MAARTRSMWLRSSLFTTSCAGVTITPSVSLNSPCIGDKSQAIATRVPWSDRTILSLHLPLAEILRLILSDSVQILQ